MCFARIRQRRHFQRTEELADALTKKDVRLIFLKGKWNCFKASLVTHYSRNVHFAFFFHHVQQLSMIALEVAAMPQHSQIDLYDYQDELLDSAVEPYFNPSPEQAQSSSTLMKYYDAAQMGQTIAINSAERALAQLEPGCETGVRGNFWVIKEFLVQLNQQS